MVAALILYYMTFSYDIYVVLRATASEAVTRETDVSGDVKDKQK